MSKSKLDYRRSRRKRKGKSKLIRRNKQRRRIKLIRRNKWKKVINLQEWSSSSSNQKSMSPWITLERHSKS